MIESAIKQSIKNACQDVFSHQLAEIELVNPEPQFGDFALACHPFAKELKLSPQDIAEKLAQAVKGEAIVSATALVGYLNITVDSVYLARTVLGAVIKADKHYGTQPPGKERILMEYSSPNTNKPLHLGHVRNNVLGMAMSHLLEAVGKEVKKVQIINDRGIHIIKSMLAYQKWGEGQTPDDTGEKGDHFVGKFYVKFEQEFEREWQSFLDANIEVTDLPEEARAKQRQAFFGESTIGAEAQAMLRAWEAGEPTVRALWEKMNQWVYDGFAETYGALGSEFDKNYYESNTYLAGKKIVADGLARGVFYQEADGSIWIDLTGMGLDKKILQRADGTAVYMTQDLGLAAERAAEWQFAGATYVVGHEQEYHFKVLFAILKKLGYAWADKLRHLSYGLVFLPEGKMKSREGKVVDADTIIAEVKNLAVEEIKNRTPEILESDLNERAGAIGLGALKFFLLRVTPTQSIHYNPAEAIAFEGATGPYVQYAHARIASILAEETPLPADRVDFGKLKEPEEKILLLKLLSYPKIIKQAADNFSPNTVCDYLVNLGRAFNIFYHQHKVLRAADDDTKHARLVLIKAAQIVLRNGLGLLGIKALDKM